MKSCPEKQGKSTNAQRAVDQLTDIMMTIPGITIDDLVRASSRIDQHAQNMINKEIQS